MINALFNTKMIQLSFVGKHTKADGTKWFQRSYLSEQQLNKLVSAFKIPYPVVAAIALYTLVKFILVHKVQQLTENIFVCIHISHFISAKMNLLSIQISKSKNVDMEVNTILTKRKLTGLIIDKSGWVKKKTKALVVDGNIVATWAKYPSRRAPFLPA